jgi:hypothetical protein
VSATGSALGYLGSFTDFQSAIGSSDIRSYLGAYGRDASTSTVWAVVNHNSEFAVVPVPEPAALALATLAGGMLLPRILRRLAPAPTGAS